MISPNSRILIVRLSAIGDVILTLPAVHALRKAYPNAYFVWALESAPYNLLQGHPEINDFILFPKKEIKMAVKEAGLSAGIKLLKEFGQLLQTKKIDTVIDFQNLFKSGIVGLLAKANTRLGYDYLREGSRFFLTKVFPRPPKTIHFVDWQLELVRKLGIPVNEVKFILPDYQPENLTVQAFLTKNKLTGPFFCIATGTSWANKCWTPAGMAQLADKLAPYGQVLFIGSEIDRVITETTINLMTTTPINTIGLFNLRELAVLLKKATLFCGGDTGPMHLAVAVNTSVVVWMGPTDERRLGPYQQTAVTLSPKLSCQPCHRRKCKNVACMQKLTFEQVWAATKPKVENLIS